jgi:hypothetical protein
MSHVSFAGRTAPHASVLFGRLRSATLGRILFTALGCILFATLKVPVAAAGFTGFSPEGDGALYPAEGNGRKTEVPKAVAYALNGEPVTLDGKLDDPAWRDAPAATGFHVWDPDRGALPTEETVFKVAYDTDAVYFAIACLEEDPAKIETHLSRRDRFTNSDIVSVYIDPYLDKSTGYNFRVNPDGVQMDSYMFNDGERDDDWDAVWEAETTRDDHGWYVEMRIPFSSIRYRPADSMTWGLQVYRYMHARGEDTAWVTWPRETRGFISRFGELQGLRNVPPPRQLEIAPYFVDRLRDPSTGPANDDMDNLQNFGADVKYGVTADLTLNATLQPDFGQVEADPAVLNLSPFETFFEEKRPFFIEGSRFFEHPDFTLFYSRRIGTGSEDSRIRFAGKLTGKLAGGISVATLLATTDVAGHGQAHNPFKTGEQKSHYLVSRFGKEFNDGAHRINLMQTAAVKTADRDLFGNYASRDAYTTGLDFDLNFHNRDYNIQGSMVGSVINPEESRDDPSINTGKHYGTGGALDIRRLGGAVHAGIYGRWESAKLDLNDVGFLSAPDEMNSGLWVSYQYTPDGKSKLFNRGELNYNLWKNWLYAGRSGKDINTGETVWAYGRGHRQNAGTNVNGWAQFRSYWEGWAGIEIYPEGTQRYETRGGPLISEPLTYGGWAGMNTDTRKSLNFEADMSHFRDTAINHSTHVNLSTHWSQSSALNHEIGVGFTYRKDDTQYLETVNLNDRPGGQGIGGLSYVFGKIDQRTLDITLRSNILFSRKTSLEIYAQPFITVGDYSQARELAVPDTYDLIPYREAGYNVAASDFSFTAVNLNLVYRWEYRPGSALYLVWTHSRSQYDERGSEPGTFQNRVDTSHLFRNEPENILLAKVSYWFAL